MKPASEIILTDTHLNKNNIEDNYSIFDQVIKKAQSLGLKRVIHIGDIFSNRESLSLVVLIAFSKIIQKFKDANVELIAIAGNHDKLVLNSDESYLNIFSKYDSFTYIEKPKQIKSSCENMNLFLLPYYKEVDMYPELLKEISGYTHKKNNNILLTHIAVNGVMNNDGTIVSNAIPVGSFKVFDKVFVGHYHNRSQVGDNVYYIGSAMPHNFGEDSNKGFTILYTDGSHEYFKPKFKQYLSFDVPVSQIDHFLTEPSYQEYVKSGDVVEFVLIGDESAVKAIDKKTINELGIKCKNKSTLIEKNIQMAENEKLVKFNHSNIIGFFSIFCEEEGYDSKMGIEKLKYVADKTIKG